MTNSLGIFEHTSTFALIHSIYATVSTFLNRMKQDEKKSEIIEAVNNLQVQ